MSPRDFFRGPLIRTVVNEFCLLVFGFLVYEKLDKEKKSLDIITMCHDEKRDINGNEPYHFLTKICTKVCIGNIENAI